MFSASAPIVDANAKTFDLLMIIAVILFVIVTAWHFTLRTFVTAVWCLAFAFMAFAFLFLS